MVTGGAGRGHAYRCGTGRHTTGHRMADDDLPASGSVDERATGTRTHYSMILLLGDISYSPVSP